MRFAAIVGVVALSVSAAGAQGGRAVLELVRGSEITAREETDGVDLCLNPSAYILAVQGSSASVVEHEEARFLAFVYLADDDHDAEGWGTFQVVEPGCFKLVVTSGGRARVYRLLVGVDWEDAP